MNQLPPECDGIEPEKSAPVRNRVGKRMQIALILSALQLPACNQQDENHVSEAMPSASTHVSDAKSRFSQPDYRADFARRYASNLKLRWSEEGFFLPMDYAWKLEEAMLKERQAAGLKGEVPCDALKQTESAVLTLALERLSVEWSDMRLKNRQHSIFRGPYHKSVYTHYRYIRTLESLPEQCEPWDLDYENLSKESSDRNFFVWKLVDESPYYGAPKGKSVAGPFDEPFKEAMLQQMAEFNSKMPPKGHPYHNPSHGALIRTATLDMYLPAIYLEAIQSRIERADISSESLGFSEEVYESMLKEAFARRAAEFLKTGRHAASKIDKRLYNRLGLKFMTLSEMDHILEFYQASQNGATSRD